MKNFYNFYYFIKMAKNLLNFNKKKVPISKKKLKIILNYL